MRLILIALMFSLFSSPAFSLTIDDLVERQGLYYKKFTNTPYSGDVGGKHQGKIKNGKKEGVWDYYRESGQLAATEVYKNGKENGESVGYTKNGNVYYRGQMKDGLAVGEWLTYFFDSSQVSTKQTFKDGKEHGLTYGYNKDGSLDYTVEVSQGKWNGLYTDYDEDGTVWKTTEFKNGVKVSELSAGEGSGDQISKLYFEFAGTFTTNLAGSRKMLQVGIGVSTIYDDTVISNLESHQLALRSVILGVISDFSDEDVKGETGRENLAEALRDAINSKLETLENFGGVESVHFTSFVIA